MKGGVEASMVESNRPTRGSRMRLPTHINAISSLDVAWLTHVSSKSLPNKNTFPTVLCGKWAGPWEAEKDVHFAFVVRSNTVLLQCFTSCVTQNKIISKCLLLDPDGRWFWPCWWRGGGRGLGSLKGPGEWGRERRKKCHCSLLCPQNQCQLVN